MKELNKYISESILSDDEDLDNRNIGNVELQYYGGLETEFSELKTINEETIKDVLLNILVELNGAYKVKFIIDGVDIVSSDDERVTINVFNNDGKITPLMDWRNRLIRIKYYSHPFKWTNNCKWRIHPEQIAAKFKTSLKNLEDKINKEYK